MTADLRPWQNVSLMSAVSFVAGFAAAWGLFVVIYEPTDSQFLSTTTSAYLEYASKRGEQAHVSFDDCRLEDVSADDRKRLGIAKYGVCRYDVDGKLHVFSVALSELANVEFIEE